MRRTLIIAAVVLAVAGAGVGGYFLGKKHGRKAGYVAGHDRGMAKAERAERPIEMPLLLATDHAAEALAAAAPEVVGAVPEGQLEAWAGVVNVIPSVHPVHRKDGLTLAHTLMSEDLGECAGCAAQSAYAADLLAAGWPVDEARGRLYRDARAEFDTDGAVAFGPADAAVQLAWFTDFQCPYCAESALVVRALTERYPDQLRIVVMNLPLRMHTEADEAARASLAAHGQGRFWEMADVLFDQRRKLKKHVPEDGGVALLKQARQAGLDLDRYRADYLDEGTDALVREHRKQARAHGVRGVPAYFINGHKVKIRRDVNSFAGYIDEILAGEDPVLAR